MSSSDKPVSLRTIGVWLIATAAVPPTKKAARLPGRLLTRQWCDGYDFTVTTIAVPPAIAAWHSAEVSITPADTAI